MHLTADAILLSVRAHGEHGAVARALTRVDGVRPGYVRGGHSRGLRPVLQPGNVIRGEWRARTAEQLAALTVELVHSRAALHAAPLPAAALEWLTALTAAALPEAQPYPHLHDALSGVLDAIEAAPSARGWAAAMARYELLVLAELGFGLDLSACVATGATDDLAFVSPKSGGAVSRAAAAGYEARLFALPRFLSAGGAADWDEVLAALAITGHFLARDVLVDRRRDPLAARARLLERLQRAVA
ncbi:DNA repair protein RecO (recombination protein O) [Sphingomonas sp. BE138]|uniref:DNA repair protein RecO n=1 Tax=Sphingomonas sp. BE138 TaxID=2817845 RepID=UPI00285ADF40|nr:DNA repair protein RecO [Sphingomonas sp. BE138]MDR6789813.1 DNA repair protein RecO (recombination protein O) [Sphingomonas sp. BE138]